MRTCLRIVRTHPLLLFPRPLILFFSLSQKLHTSLLPPSSSGLARFASAHAKDIAASPPSQEDPSKTSHSSPQSQVDPTRVLLPSRRPGLWFMLKMSESDE
ncbi:unnamed protein product [Linum trigynum]|uniref:Uncharacterized protein n=1 Tax=Linum trigynum TaxID=586398 RepID=A0AAV2FYB2_9ROSI